MADLRVQFAGVEFPNPVFISSSSLTNHPTKLRRLQDAGAGAVITKLATSARPPTNDRQPYRSTYIGHGTWSVASGDRRLSIQDGVELIRQAKKDLHIPIIANVIGKSYFAESWVENALALQAAGADMLEMDFNCQIFHEEKDGEPAFTGDGITFHPDYAAAMVHALKQAVKIPVIAKLSPVFNDMTELGLAVKNGGGDGLSAVNAMAGFAGVDVHNGGKPLYMGMEGEDGRPVQSFSALLGTDVTNISSRHTIMLVKNVGLPVCSGGGVSDWNVAVQRLMMGATTVQICTAIYLGGLKALTDCVQGINHYLDEYGYQSPADIQGLALQYIVTNNEKITYYPLKAEIVDPTWSGWPQVVDRVQADCLALTLQNGIPVINPEECTGCGLCAFDTPDGVVKLSVIKN